MIRRVATKKMLAFASALCIALLLSITLAGCGSQKPSYDAELGEASDDAVTTAITNDTSKPISFIALSEGENLLEEGKALEAGKVAALYTPKNLATANIVLKIGEKDYVLHDVAFADIEKASLKVEDELAFLEYEANGNKVSTLEAEQAIRKAAEEAARKAAEEEAARIAAEEEAARLAEEEAAAEEEGEYYEEYYYEPQEYYEAPATGGSQSEDACVEGGILFR